jgi:hypothetical protein
VQARVRSFAQSLGSSLKENRRHAGIAADGADRRVLQAANAALAEFEVTLAPIRLRHEQQEEELRLFRDLCKDRVKVTKQDGRVFENVSASVQRGMVHFPDARVPIQDGDAIERTLPGGAVERYMVTDAGFQHGLHGIPDHYQSQVQKEGGAPRGDARASATTTIYNMSGPQARINVNSTDASTNIINVDSPTLFSSMRDAVAASGMPEPTRDELIRRIDAMEAESNRPSLAKRYAEFVSSAADHLEIFGPYLPALAQLLVRAGGG